MAGPSPRLVVAGGEYLRVVLAYRQRRGRRWSRWRMTSWLTGVMLVELAVSPAPEAFADEARGHMVQHLLLGIFVPLGLVMGAPVSLLLGASPPSAGRNITRVLRSGAFHVVGHPVSAAILIVGGMFVLYLTPLYAVSTQHTVRHHLVHAHFLAAGYLFTWSIIGPDPAPRRPGMGTRVTVLVLGASPPIAPGCSR